jgi:hypothetical protein
MYRQVQDVPVGACSFLRSVRCGIGKNKILQTMEEKGKMFIILDSFEEISPYYTLKVNILITAIRDKTATQGLVSSRFSYQQKLEETLLNWLSRCSLSAEKIRLNICDSTGIKTMKSRSKETCENLWKIIQLVFTELQ